MTMTPTLYDASHPYDWDAIEDQIESRLAQRISEKEEYLLYLLQILIADARSGKPLQQQAEDFTEAFTAVFDSWEPALNYFVYLASLARDPIPGATDEQLLGIRLRAVFLQAVTPIASASHNNKEGSIWKGGKYLLDYMPFFCWLSLASVYLTTLKEWQQHNPDKGLACPNPLA